MDRPVDSLSTVLQCKSLGEWRNFVSSVFSLWSQICLNPHKLCSQLYPSQIRSQNMISRNRYLFWAHLCLCTVGSYASLSVWCLSVSKIQTRKKLISQKVSICTWSPRKSRWAHINVKFLNAPVCYSAEANFLQYMKPIKQDQSTVSINCIWE